MGAQPLELVDGFLLFEGFDGPRACSPNAGDGVFCAIPLSHQVRREQRPGSSQPRAAMDGHPFASAERLTDGRYTMIQLVLAWWVRVGHRQVQRLSIQPTQHFRRVGAFVKIDQQADPSRLQLQGGVFADRRIDTSPKLLRKKPIEGVRVHLA